jgi:hypothetical protein
MRWVPRSLRSRAKPTRCFASSRATRPSQRPRGIAEDRAVQAGAARATLKTVDVEDMPITYLPGNALRVRVRVAGDLVKAEVPAAA